MKINGNSINAVSAYIHSASDTAMRKSVKASGKRTVDRVEFSDAAKAALERNAAVKEKKAEAVREVRDSASPERIAALRDSVASGSYNVSSEDIAKSILGL